MTGHINIFLSTCKL